MADIVSFGEHYLRGGFMPPVPHDQVRRIALEGGGGKGNAYLGALFALDQLSMLDQLDIVAGSSAGAITALALSLGMKPVDVFQFMKRTDFTRFFDQDSDAVPEVGRPYRRGEDRVLRTVVAAAWRKELLGITLAARARSAIQGVLAGLGPRLAQTLGRTFLRPLDVDFVLRPFALPPRVREPGGGEVKPRSLEEQVLDQVVGSLPGYLTSLSFDTGIFSGEVARDVIADLIAERIGPNVDLASGGSVAGPAPDGRSVTFSQLDTFCRARGYPRLRVTGSEMCRLRSVIFSGARTPEFPVADAVRISMGLPFVYKPYTIRKAVKGWPACGVYVDGGVFCNLPLIAFDDQEARQAVGFRLEIDKPTKVDGFGSARELVARCRVWVWMCPGSGWWRGGLGLCRCWMSGSGGWCWARRRSCWVGVG